MSRSGRCYTLPYHPIRSCRFRSSLAEFGIKGFWEMRDSRKKSKSGFKRIGRLRDLRHERSSQTLLPLVARAYGATEKDLVQAGRQPYALRAGLGSLIPKALAVDLDHRRGRIFDAPFPGTRWVIFPQAHKIVLIGIARIRGMRR